MRLVLVLSALALGSAFPASASPHEATGGVAAPSGTTGGMAVPGATDYGAAVNEGALAAGDAAAGESPERSAGPGKGGPPHHESAAGVSAQAAQDGQPDVPPTQEERDEGDVDVQVPIDEGDRERGATQPTPPSVPFGGLAPTGLAVAAFAALGAAAAAGGLGLRRLAR